MEVLLYSHGHPIYLFHEDVFGQKNIIITSDLHDKSKNIFTKLNQLNMLTPTTLLIMCGDMAGDGTKGSDGDPYPVYKKLSEIVGELYFVQGNHDIYNNKSFELCNKNGNPCCVDNICVDTIIGRIGGVNGIIGKNNLSRHKYREEEYFSKISNILSQQPDILLTHEAPEIIENTMTKHIKHNGNHKLFEMVNGKIKYHIYGHCHHWRNKLPIIKFDKTTFICVDASVIYN